MQNEWDELNRRDREALTNAQKSKVAEELRVLRNEAVEALRRLVASNGAKDLIKELFIADTTNWFGDHSFALYLTINGLQEKMSCSGHPYVDMIDEHGTDYCDKREETKEVSENDFEKVVRDYKLTQAKLEQLHNQLNT